VKAACCHRHCGGGTGRAKRGSWGGVGDREPVLEGSISSEGEAWSAGVAMRPTSSSWCCGKQVWLFAADVGLRAWANDPDASPVTRIHSASGTAEGTNSSFHGLRLTTPQASLPPALHSFTRHAAPVLLLTAHIQRPHLRDLLRNSQHARLAFRTIMTIRPSRPQA
jgi:hypothetical protein